MSILTAPADKRERGAGASLRDNRTNNVVGVNPNVSCRSAICCNANIIADMHSSMPIRASGCLAEGATGGVEHVQSTTRSG